MPPLDEHSLERWLTGGERVPEPGTAFTGLDELGKAMVLSRLTALTKKPVLVVLPSRGAARNALDNYAFFAGEERAARAHYLPCVEFDFFRGLLPNPEVLQERNVALFHALDDPEGRIFFTSVRSLLQKVVPPDEFLRAVQVLKAEQELDRDALVASLHEAGYQAQPTAYDPGVFAVRGGVIDVFSPLYDQPFRLEFFGDLIESIRLYDPKTQLSAKPLEKAFVVPVGQTLMPRGRDFAEASLKIKERLDHLGVAKNRREEILEKIADGHSFSELPLLFPLLSKGSASPLRYFTDETVVVWDGVTQSLQVAEETELPSLQKNHSLYEKEPVAIAERDQLFVGWDEFREIVDRRRTYAFEAFRAGQGKEMTLDRAEARLHMDRTPHKGNLQPMLTALAGKLREWIDLGRRVNFVCHTRTHAERLQMLMEPYGFSFELHPEGREVLPPLLTADFRKIHLWQGFITHGQQYPGLGVVLVGEEEVFGQKKRQARAVSKAWTGAADPNRLLNTFRDLRTGDLVVHKEHGIGRYLGLRSMQVQGLSNDFVLLEYKDGDKLYVPIYRLNVLQKYVGAEGAAAVSVDKLGTDRWIKAKRKAQKAVAELAGELLKIQARRKLLPAHAYSAPGKDYAQFEMEFPFDETPDQMKAIDDTMADMGRPHPMDRLVCGDVGYGKTEVAMRAAYRAVLDNKQVAVLVPTTVLAFQHYETFKKRFQSTPTVIQMVSRLRSNAEVKKILADLKEGKIDILIGTHRLLSSDVQFRDLGLVVVDEEHRFGVVHKERLKKWTESVHYLTMTATPIPRTLNMAMSGIKDISVITTPPPDRLSVRTFVSRRTDELIAEAIGNELARDGQVFFVHNRIETQGRVAEELQRLLPKVALEVVHGQMDPETLEKKMLNFYRGDARILLTTAIIESGLDIPRANTILIDQADHFGLAQLYQLRGRVGRSERRAYCYLLVNNENAITEDAKERLQVIQRYTDLGAGFQVASHDLELRGAGDLLGRDQSGHLTAIGVDYYFELLEDSIRALRGVARRVDVEPEINLRVAAYFPEDYLPDLAERINLYRRLSSVETEEQVSEIEEEIRDRFGGLPEEVTNLLGLMRIKLYLKRLHVTRMGVGPKRTSLQFAPTTPVKPEVIVGLVQKGRGRYSMTPDGKLVFEVEDTTWGAQLREIQRLCVQLGVEV